MTENQLIYQIRQIPRLSRLFDKCSRDQKQAVIEIADGDIWNLGEIIEFVLEEEIYAEAA